MREIDLTPTPEGFAAMATALCQSICRGEATTPSRGRMLYSVLETVVYLTKLGRDDLVRDIRESIA